MNVVPCLHNIERVNVIRNWHSFVPSWDSENKRNAYHIGYLLVNVWEKRKHKHKDKNPCLNHIKRPKVGAQNPWDSFWKLWPSFQQRIHITQIETNSQVSCVLFIPWSARQLPTSRVSYALRYLVVALSCLKNAGKWGVFKMLQRFPCSLKCLPGGQDRIIRQRGKSQAQPLGYVNCFIMLFLDQLNAWNLLEICFRRSRQNFILVFQGGIQQSSSQYISELFALRQSCVNLVTFQTID